MVQSICYELMQSFFICTLVHSFCAAHWCIASVLYIGAELLRRTLMQSLCAVHWCLASVLYIGSEFMCCALMQSFSTVVWPDSLGIYFLYFTHNFTILLRIFKSIQYCTCSYFILRCCKLSLDTNHFLKASNILTVLDQK
jgi:hypothetical protein